MVVATVAGRNGSVRAWEFGNYIAQSIDVLC